jgi:hypothetical protein
MQLAFDQRGCFPEALPPVHPSDKGLAPNLHLSRADERGRRDVSKTRTTQRLTSADLRSARNVNGRQVGGDVSHWPGSSIGRGP